MSDTPPKPDEESKKPTLVDHGKKAIEKADKAAAVAESASNAFSAVKWTAIAIVTLTIAGTAYGVYKMVSAPAKAVGNAAGAVTDTVKTGAGKIKEGGADVINRLDIPAANQDKLDRVSEAAFTALTSMAISEPGGIKDRLYRKTNFGGNDGRICTLTVDFGNGDIPVTLAADNEAYATAKALGSKDNRLMRMIVTAGDDDIALSALWDEQAQGWVLKWKATTLKKPISDSLAEARANDVLKAAAERCE